MRKLLILICIMASACSSRPSASEFPRTESYAINGEQTPLGKTITSLEAGHSGKSGFLLLPNGSDSLITRIALIEAAQQTIDLQYYSTVDDTTGKLLLQTLLRAADRGVRVRMLLDDWNLDEFRHGAAALNKHRNIEIRVFNPYVISEETPFAYVGNAIFHPERIMRRMHNKAIVGDNEAAIMGGRNLGNEYFDASDGLNFNDMDVLALGRIAGSISHNFDMYWNSELAYPLAALNIPESDETEMATVRADLKNHWEEVSHTEAGKWLNHASLTPKLKSGQMKLIWANAELVADKPEKVEQPVKETVSKPVMKLDQLVDRANKEFLIISPYFVPQESGVEWMASLEKRGVEVRAITNSLAATDVVPAYTGYARYREPMLDAGVDLFEMKPDLNRPTRRPMFKASSHYGLHSKVYVVDRTDVMIGSFNLDPRSIKLNTEQVLVIHSPELGAQVGQLFETLSSPKRSYRLVKAAKGLEWHAEEKGEAKIYDSEPPAGFRRKAMSLLFSLLPIEGQL